MQISKKTAGFSVIEVMIAAAVFIIFASGSVAVVLQGFDFNRTGAEMTIANQYASEGIEAIRSLKNQSFGNLTSTFCVTGTGLNQVGGLWVLTGSGTSDVFQKYTRVIKICDTQRDGSGNIVNSGGQVDTSTKKVTTTVSWNLTPTRTNSIVLTTYLTNWRPPGGILVYGDGSITSDAIKYKTLDNLGNWSIAALTADVDTGTTNKALRIVRLYASSTSNEKIAISRHYDGSNQYIYTQVFNGTTWGSVQLLSSWSANSYLDVQNFDGAYLANGTFMTVFSDNTSIPKMRTWNGTAWSAQTSLTDLTGTQVPAYIVVKARPRTNEVMANFFTKQSNTISEYWNGSSWSGLTVHATAAPDAVSRLIDFAWSPNNALIGELIFLNTAGDKGIHARIWTANGSGSGSWSVVADSSTDKKNVGAVAVAGKFGSNEFSSCYRNPTTTKISCFTTDFTPTFTDPNNQNITTSLPNSISRSFDITYAVLAGTPGLIVYSDNTTVPKYKKYTPGTATWDAATSSITTTGSPGVFQTVRLIPQQESNDSLALMVDANKVLYSIFWDGTNQAMYTSPLSKAFFQHGTNGSNSLDFWYDFAWDKF